MIIHYADPPSFDTTDSNWTRGRCEIHVFKLLVHPEDFQAMCSSSASHRQASHCQDPQVKLISFLFASKRRETLDMFRFIDQDPLNHLCHTKRYKDTKLSIRVPK